MKTLYGIILFAYLLLYACSYDDKSIRVEKELPDIIIDTTGISGGGARLHIYQDSLVSIHPEIIYEGATEADFEYEWRLGIEAISEVAGSPGEYIVLSKEKNLEWKVDIPAPPSYKAQHLWFRVRHKQTGVIASVKWLLWVTGSETRGLLVVDTEDGKTCDISLIKDSVFEGGRCHFFTDDGKGMPTEYERNIYSAKNGHKFDGIIKGMFHQKLYKGAGLVHYMHGFTDNNRIFRMTTSDFRIVAEGSELFYDPTVELKIDNYRDFGPWSDVKGILINDGKLYRRENEEAGSTTIRKFGNPQKQICRIPPQVCGNEELAFFSEEEGRFYMTDVRWFDDSKAPEPFTTVEGALFDPNNMAGYKNVIAGEYFGNEFRFILKKEGKYVFCTLSYKGMPALFFDLSQAPEIDRAISFGMDTYESLIFYATTDKVYVINYASDLQYAEFYDPAEPIQEIYMNNGSYDADMSNTLYSILVNTYDGNEGRLYFMRYTKSGEIDNTYKFARGVSVFDGFKKIVWVANSY